jgi:hypothetical protein
MGLSSHPAGRHDKRTQAADMPAALTHPGLDRVAVVRRDIGTMVAYAYARIATLPSPFPQIRPSSSGSDRGRPIPNSPDGRPDPIEV